MDRDKDKSSPAPADHKKSEQTRNQSTYVENKSKKFSAFFWIFIIIMIVGAALIFFKYF